ncbi:PDDEXK-like family protein [Leisingera sp. ANG-M6]|uniref:PDDEXK-like family protein n=1 Tax=Leisingera sp. ANG-M6 TaxID=1577900 RepID=UPI000691EFAC|nr:PD-(D/E)XK nuclease family protein [Leisingera sp. ANG-M6]
MQTKDQMPSHGALEALFVNNEHLERIEAYLNRFNPIRVMKMERMEIRHSAILAWLLDPSETHGLGDRFLKVFLAEAYRGSSLAAGPTALEISQADMRDAEVRCEWLNIDIFILSERNRWAFVIENKFDSKLHGDQLANYMRKVRGVYKTQEDLQIQGVFLTLRDEAFDNHDYVPIGYGEICTFLSRFLEQEAYLLRPEISTFLTHYIEILQEATGMSKERDEMVKLARELYRSHKKVLDFVIEHGAASEFAMAAHEQFGDSPGPLEEKKIGKGVFCFGALHRDGVSFLPQEWVAALGRGGSWPGCENWWMGFPLTSWLALVPGDDGSKGQLRLFAEVGPLSDHAARKALIEEIEGVAASEGLSRIRFQKGAAGEGKRYSKFLKNNTLEIRDVHDAEEISAAMKKLLDKFRPEFVAIAEVLPGFMSRKAVVS